MKTKKRTYDGIVYLLLVVLCVLITFTDFIQRADTNFADALYQRGNISSGKIVLVELDEKTLEQFGATPASWNRSIYAQVVNYLNKSEDCHPAVIGLDVLFAYDKDALGDQALVNAASKFNNIVTAEKITYETAYAIDGRYYSAENTASDLVSPYEDLNAVTSQGIVNPVPDMDGVIRHIRLRYQGPDGSLLPSFPLAVAEKYHEETSTAFSVPTENDLHLEYTFPSGGYSESISLLDVYNGTIPAEYFHGKIVLIGAYATALQDDYRTAIDRRETMHGVEIHANAIEMLLREAHHREVSNAAQRAPLVLILAVCTAIFSSVSLPWMVGCWGSLSIGSLLGCSGLYRLGYIVHPLWLPLGITVLFIAGIALRFASEAIQRKLLREQFEKYVDPQVLDQIISQGGVQLTGSKRDIAVLFVDICGFTSLSESRSPEEVVAILNRFLELMTDCVMKNHGTLDKFVGDCCMALWNAPVTQEEPLMCAVRAGMDMITASEQLNKQLGMHLGFAVGIHWGEAVVGNIGCTKRMDYTAIGDTVNIASRLESLKISGHSREGKIYISKEVLEKLHGRIKVDDLGIHEIKGKVDRLQIYSVTGIVE